MPKLGASNVQGSRYKRPFGQSFFHSYSRVADIFDSEDYFNEDAMKLSAQDFSVQQVFQFYIAQVSREN